MKLQILRKLAIRVLGKTHFVERFRPMHNLKRESRRAYFEGLRVRLLLACGFGVVVVGGCGSGKTFLLERALPGRVIRPENSMLLRQGIKQPLPDKLPVEAFALDEPMAYEPDAIRKAIPVLRGKRVAFAVQSLSHFEQLGLFELFEERLVVVFVGSKEDWKIQCNHARGVDWE